MVKEQEQPVFPAEPTPRLHEFENRTVDFRQFLTQSYLPGYMEILRQRYPDDPPDDSLGDAIHDTAKLLHSMDPENSTYIISSMATNIAKGMNPRYWRVFNQITLEKDEYGDNLDVAQYFDNPRSFDPDPDMDIVYGTLSVDDIADMLLKSDMTKHRLIREEIRTNGDMMTTYSFDTPLNEAYTLHIDFGPIPTNRKIHLLRVFIKSAAHPERPSLFHFDVGSIPHTGIELAYEKRTGFTTSWQDIRLPMVREDDGLKVLVDKEVTKTLASPDHVMTTPTELKDLGEIFFRTIRKHTLHPIDGVYALKNEYIDKIRDPYTVPSDPEAYEYIPLPNVEMMMPDIANEKDSPSAFQLRDRIIAAIARGEHLPTDDAAFFLKKELQVALITDPYLTIQLLRDSGATLLIPKLRHVSRSILDRILQNQYFIADVREPYMDSPERLKHHHDHYTDKSATGADHYNGVERFVMALVDERIIPFRDNYLSTYLSLWERDDISILQTEPLLDMFKTEEGSIDRLNRTVEMLYEQCEGTYLEPVFDEYMISEKEYRHALEKYGDESRIPMAIRAPYMKLRNHLYNLALLYTLIDQYPIGMTPREIESMYYQVPAWFTKKSKTFRFRTLFLELKTLGLLERVDSERVNIWHRKDPVSFYNIRTEASTEPFDVLMAPQSDMQTWLAGLTTEAVRYGNKDSGLTADELRDRFRRYMKVLWKECGFTDMESLATLKWKDVDEYLLQHPDIAAKYKSETLYEYAHFVLWVYAHFGKRKLKTIMPTVNTIAQA